MGERLSIEYRGAGEAMIMGFSTLRPAALNNDCAPQLILATTNLPATVRWCKEFECHNLVMVLHKGRNGIARGHAGL